jgi:hypothetical protein
VLNERGSFVESIGFHYQRFDVNAYYLYNSKTETCTKLGKVSYIKVDAILSPDKKHGLKPSGEGRAMHTQKDYQLILLDSSNKEKQLFLQAEWVPTY